MKAAVEDGTESNSGHENEDATQNTFHENTEIPIIDLPDDETPGGETPELEGETAEEFEEEDATMTGTGAPHGPALDLEVDDFIDDGNDDGSDNEDGNDGGPIDTPPPGNPPEHIPSNTFAGAYCSAWTNKIPPTAKGSLMGCLTNVNCNYLSTSNRAPTLTELKQHAQALTILIKHITLSTSSAVVDNVNSGITDAAPFTDGETYDWLNNLNTRYTGPTNANLITHHNLPLTSILNNLRTRQDDQGNTIFENICPLHSASDIPPNAPALPYATRQALIEHANEVLELIDHEYSSQGGLLSILPEKDKKEDRKKAESTLLGQFVLYTNRLVQRLHDLERLYANAVDALAGEAVAPLQALSRLGPDGRKGREIIYPQDRFVLVNAGEDVWQFLNSEFQRKERTDEKVDEMYKKHGVTGETLWQNRGGKEFSRGITVIDVVTRYYRIRGSTAKTIFVIPAHAQHPGTKVTREMELQPTVVSVVKPTWPERQSQWEMKHRAELEAYKILKNDHMRVEQELEIKTQAEKALQSTNERLEVNNQDLLQERNELQSLLSGGDPKSAEATLIASLRRDLNKYKEEREKSQEDLAAARQRLANDRARFEEERTRDNAVRDNWRRQQDDFDRRRREETEDRRQWIAMVDQDQATTAQKLQDELHQQYQALLQETIAIRDVLRRAALDIDVNKLTIPQDIRNAAGNEASTIIDGLIDHFNQSDANVNVENVGGTRPRHDIPRSNSTRAPRQRGTRAAEGETRVFEMGRGVRFQDEDEVMYDGGTSDDDEFGVLG